MRPVLVSTWGPTHKKYLGAFLDTAKRNGLEPQNFDDTDWPGADWTQIPWWRKSQGQARFIQEHAGEFSHFMFTDSYDVCFAAGWTEIMAKFERIGSPIVFGAECYCWPDINQAGAYPPCADRARFLNAGFWMAETQAALNFSAELAQQSAKKDRCDQQIVVDMFLSRRHPIALDTKCSICFCLNLDSPKFLDLSTARPKTIDTHEEPCMFHANGGSNPLPVIQAIAP